MVKTVIEKVEEERAKMDAAERARMEAQERARMKKKEAEMRGRLHFLEISYTCFDRIYSPVLTGFF